MRRFKSILSVFMCIMLLLPMAVFPAQAQSQYIKELGEYMETAQSLLYSGGTAASRRKLKAVYDEAYALYVSESQYIDKVTATTEKLSAAISDFKLSDKIGRIYLAGFDVWNSETLASMTDTSGCAVFFDETQHPEGATSAIKIVSAGSDTAFFSNEGKGGLTVGENPLLGDISNSGGLRLWTKFNDVSLAESMSVSVGVRTADKHTTFTASDIPLTNGYVTIDWEFFTPDYDGIGEGIDLFGRLNYIAVTFEGISGNLIAYVSDLHCFENDVAELGDKYTETLATEIKGDKYYKIVHRETGKALSTTNPTTETDRLSEWPDDNRITIFQDNLSLSLQEASDTPAQEWQIYPMGGGRYRIISRDSSIFLASTGANNNLSPTLANPNMDDSGQIWLLGEKEGGFMISTMKSRLSRLGWNGRKLVLASDIDVWDIYECDEGDWEEVWSDEFNGTEIDRTKWNVYNGKHRPDTEPVFFRDNPKNIRTEGGNLVINTFVEDYQGYPVTGAYMTTEGRFLMSYGKVEMRAKLSVGNYIWPALWMMGVNGNWPTNGEIDIMELVGGGIEDSKLYGTFHWLSEANDEGRHTQKGVEIYNTGNTSLGDDFHTYTLEWDADQMRLYFDGMQYVSLNLTTDALKWCYGDNPHFLIVNTSIRGPGNNQIYPETAKTSEYLIDYIKVYKRTTEKSEADYEVAEQYEQGVAEDASIYSAYNIEASPNGKYFTISDFHNKIVQINAETGKKDYLYSSGQGPVTALKYSASGKFFAAGTRHGSVLMFKSEDLSSRNVTQVPGLFVEDFAFSPDEATVYFGGRNGDISPTTNQKYLYVYGSATLTNLNKIPVPSDIRTVSASSDGKYVAAGMSNGNIIVFNVEDYSEYTTLNMGGMIRNVDFIENGNKLLATNEYGDAVVYSMSEKAEAYRLYKTDNASISEVSISPDESKVVFSSSDNNARLYDLKNGRLIALLGGFEQMTSSVDFSNDGKRIVVASYDGTAKIFTDNGVLVKAMNIAVTNKTERSLHRIRFSANGDSVLATAVFDNTNAYFWKTEDTHDIIPLKEAILATRDIKSSAYTSESYDRLITVLEASNELLRKPYVSDEEMAACIGSINEAVDRLERLPGGKVVLNGFEKWSNSVVTEMTSTNAKLSMVDTELAITPYVTKSLCVSATSTSQWKFFNYSGDSIVGQNPFGADLSNSDGIRFWAKGLTKPQENGAVYIGYTGVEGSFLFKANLPTISTSGDYIVVKFNEFEHNSGGEVLDLTKINTIGFSGKGQRGMFVFTELTAYSELGEEPVITGITDGGSYDITEGECPSATWESGVGILDGNVYVKGTPITKAGEHILTVDNKGSVVTVNFSVVDNTVQPTVEGVSDRRVFDLAKGEKAVPTWDVGSATLNGEEFASGEINEVGEYELTVTNGYKITKVCFIVIDTTNDIPAGKKGDFDGDGVITVSDALAALRIAAKMAESTAEALSIGDVDGDGNITVSDALAILRVAAKMADSL